ncbi:unnamed protein product [Protopolystoma xenopodis]|uniref:Uncharacterized protein n=1 Tax=Protopolystoma xenopodis TaxID=117903 RepID=A0A448XP22_9PLAT|nr:unnamed protein product [Protopolystoma xenopodis]
MVFVSSSIGPLAGYIPKRSVGICGINPRASFSFYLIVPRFFLSTLIHMALSLQVGLVERDHLHHRYQMPCAELLPSLFSYSHANWPLLDIKIT